MRYEGRNNAAIGRGFSRLLKSKDAVIEAGMETLLRNAMTYAVTHHDHNHFGHRISRDSYGWALVHNGQIKNIQVNGGRHGEGSAEEQLRQAATMVKQEGWVGILLASMLMAFGRKKPIYFEVDYEIDLLHATQDDIRDHFADYFKPLSV